MTRIATMGTSSCATIAIAGFGAGQKEVNDKYINGERDFNHNGMSVEEFYDDILFPTSQPLGYTAEYPFKELMEALDNSEMADKFTIATLNSHQYNGMDGYWRKQLEEHGFSLIDKTNNEIGTMCYIFTRNHNRPK